MFLQISTEQVKGMHKNCDRFLGNYQSIRELIEKNQVELEDEEGDEENGIENE